MRKFIVKLPRFLSPVFASIFIFSLLLSSCTKDDNSPRKPVETNGIEVSEKVINVDSFSTLSMVSTAQQTENGTYVFQSSNNQFPDFKAGSVLVSSNDGGYLRKVTSFTKNGNSVVAFTEQASLADVFVNGEINLDFDYVDTDRELSDFFLEEELVNQLASGVTSNDNIRYDLDYPIHPNLDLQGSISFNPHIVFQLKIKDSAVDYMKLGVEKANLTVNPILLFHAQGNVNLAVQRTLANYKKRFIYFAGKIPVVMDIDFSLIGAATAQFYGSMNVPISFTNKTTVSFGVEKKNGVTRYFDDFKNNASLTSSVNWQASGDARIAIIPQFYVSFYKSLTTVFKAEPYLQMYTQYTNQSGVEDLCGEVNAGIDFSAGFSASLFGWVTLVEEKTKQFEGPKINLWKSGENNCKQDKLTIEKPSFYSDAPPPECTLFYPNMDRIYYFNYPYSYADHSKLPEGSTVYYFVRDNRGTEGQNSFPMTGGDPFRSITSTDFKYALCVDWDDKESYEFTTFVVDPNGIKSNYLTWILLE